MPCFTDCAKHASAGALIHRQQTIHWTFTQTILSSIYRHKPIVTYWALKKRQALLTIKVSFGTEGLDRTADVTLESVANIINE